MTQRTRQVVIGIVVLLAVGLAAAVWRFPVTLKRLIGQKPTVEDLARERGIKAVVAMSWADITAATGLTQSVAQAQLTAARRKRGETV